MTASETGPVTVTVPVLFPVLCCGRVHLVTATGAGVVLSDHSDVERIGWVFGDTPPAGCECVALAQMNTASWGDVVSRVWFGDSDRPLDTVSRIAVADYVNRYQLTARQVWDAHPRCLDGQFPALSRQDVVDPVAWLASEWAASGLDPQMWEPIWDPVGGIVPWAAQWWTARGYEPRSALRMWQTLLGSSAD